MQRTTVKLPDDLDARLRHEARRRGMTVSELTREAIERHLTHPTPGARRFLSAGAGASGCSDVSERIDELLAEGFGGSTPGQPDAHPTMPRTMPRQEQPSP